MAKKKNEVVEELGDVEELNVAVEPKKKVDSIDPAILALRDPETSPIIN